MPNDTYTSKSPQRPTVAADGQVATRRSATGPLTGIRVVEMAGIGPCPFAGMMLADMGAEVVRIDRLEAPVVSIPEDHDLLNRGKSSIAVDLKHGEATEIILDLVEHADVLIEGFRPGVMERRNLGPDECAARNRRLVYGRMTGWGQDGRLASAAGHDVNYIALSGVLDQIGREGDRPLPPLNLVADFGGGGMLLAFGVVSALVERAGSNLGQVVDAAMIDGSALLMTSIFGMLAAGGWNLERGTNTIPAAPFYDVYETADGRYVALGSIEPQFWAAAVNLLDLPASDVGAQHDRSRWPELRTHVAEAIKRRTRDEWERLSNGVDACLAPVLTMVEATAHPHHVDRQTFTEVGGTAQPAPAPRFSRSGVGDVHAPPRRGAHTDDVLRQLGRTKADIMSLRDRRIVA
ncbi:MAG: CaiB/BaiF CoA transferase family protein [Desertimonas sp.]